MSVKVLSSLCLESESVSQDGLCFTLGHGVRRSPQFASRFWKPVCFLIAPNLNGKGSTVQRITDVLLSSRGSYCVMFLKICYPCTW